MNKDITLIVMSAGESARFKEKCRIKKHWLRVDGKPLWLHVADSLAGRYKLREIIITASFRDCAYMRKFCNYTITQGGATRQESLQNALKLVKSEFVMVSDAARFNLDFCVIDELVAHEMDGVDCVIPVLGVNDTIFMEENLELKYLNRGSIRLVQTPQISRLSILKEALKLGEFSDESSAIANFGAKVACVQGSRKLLKLTHFEDARYFAKYFESKNSDNFIGYGFDVHRFCAPDSRDSRDSDSRDSDSRNNSIFLCGVEIPCDVRLEAHSDGDVALHALCDAMLGAIGAGDIGEWFPPNDARYKNADSKKLLQEVADFVASVGFRIVNIDIMIMAQKPKILPYKEKMKSTVGEILNTRNINIKATTMEHLGFVGREEGVCVSANVSLANYNLGDFDEDISY